MFKKIYIVFAIFVLLFSLGSITYEYVTTEDVEVIRLGTNDGWSDHVALAALFEYIIEEETDIEVVQESLDTTYIFSSLASGDNDLYVSAWLPTSTAPYEEYKDEIEHLSVPFDDAKIGLAVPSYMEDINSIEDLKGHEDEFDNTIIGIEPGSNTSQVTDTIPEVYGLDMTQQTSSTAAMLQELDTAIRNEEPIVVSLWTPHWSFAEYDIKMLDDPKEAFGAGDTLNMFSRLGFEDDYPELTKQLQTVSLDIDQMNDLIARLKDQDESDYNDIVAEFLEDNPDVYTFVNE